MPKISKEMVVAAPADAVWHVLGPGFAQIGEWATAIPASTAVSADDTWPGGQPKTGGNGAGGLIDAPVFGRLCATGLRMVAEVVETLIAYDDAGRTLTYEASEMPAFVTIARNTWTVVPLSDQGCKVTLDAQFDTRGLVGALARHILLLQVGRTSRHLGEDLRHYVEHGTPSRRKMRQLARCKRS
jgi:hypothetical protein